MGELLAVPEKGKRIIKLSDLKHEHVEFPDLDYDIQKKVMRDYMRAWDPAFNEELRLGIIKPPLEEEIWNQFHSETYTKKFRKGQMVLMAEIEGSWEPIRSVRSLIGRIEKREALKIDKGEGTELEGVLKDQTSEIVIKKPPETYFDTWYKATNNGHGYTNIKMFKNGEVKDYEGTDYEKVQKSDKEENRKHHLVLINYAVQKGGNLPGNVEIKDATKAIIEERLKFAEELGIGCDTYTPATGLPKYLSKLNISDEKFEKDGEALANGHIAENILPAAAGIRSDIHDAAAMHLELGANFVGFFLNARKNPASKGVYIITSYSL